jgi:hypothetical protein
MVVVRVAVELCYRIHWVLRDADLRLRRWPVSSRAFLIHLALPQPTVSLLEQRLNLDRVLRAYSVPRDSNHIRRLAWDRIAWECIARMLTTNNAYQACYKQCSMLTLIIGRRHSL